MAKEYTGPPPILVGYDGSDDAEQALRYAATLAARSKTMLQVVFVADDTVVNSAWGVVFDDSDLQATGRRELAEAAALAHELGVAKKRIRTKVAVGVPIGVLTQLSQDCSLVAVGRSADSAEVRQLSGSTAVGLAGSVRCPLVVVAETPTDVDGPVVVALDPSGAGSLALRWALDDPTHAGRPVHVVSVCRPPQNRFFRTSVSPEQIDSAVQHTQAAQRRLIDAAVAGRGDLPTVTSEVRYGSTVDELAQVSETASALVLEAAVRFPTYSIGSVARGMMAFASCPVVLVK